ncbi:MAG: PAS domain S-box protein, partial [Planctomycetota bacterium]
MSKPHVSENAHSREHVERTLQFTNVLYRVSSRFVGKGDINNAVKESLRDIGALSGASRAYLFLFREGDAAMDNTHEWCADGVSPQIDNLQNLPCESFPWWMKKLRNGETIHIEGVSALPEDAEAERKLLESQGIKSLLVFPLRVRGNLAGFIGFDNVITTGRWANEDLALLQVASEIIGSAIERLRAEDALREQSRRNTLVLKTSMDGFFIVGGDGIIREANRAFSDMTGYSQEELNGMPLKDIEAGESAEEIAKHMEVIRKKGRDRFETKYRCKDGRIVTIEISTHFADTGEDGFFFVFARDITERKKTEESRARLLHELAERVKELRCLYSVTKILREPGNTLDDIFQKTVNLMPQAWQYPEITCARIIYEGKEFKTQNFKETEWKQSSDITMSGKKVGTLEVYYAEERPETGEGPFLAEERQLIDVLALEMGEAIERRQGEKALRESEKRYRELVENMTSGVAVYEAVDNGKDFVLKEFNSAGEKIARLDRKYVIGKRITEAFPGVKEFGLFEVLQRVWRTGKPEYLPAALYKDERIPGGWRENRVYRLPTGEVVAIYNDITERKQAEEEKERLATIIEQATEGVAWADLDGNLQYVNTAWARMHGYESCDELVGKHLSILHTSEQMENDVIPFNRKVKSNGHNTGYIRHIRKDGTAFPTEMTTTLMKDNEGKPTGLAAIMTDITERRQAEERLLRAQKMQTLGTMAGGVAHDYNNLLVGVLGFASLIAGEPEISDKVRSWARNVEKAAKRMANLTRQLLAFGRGGKWVPSVLDMNKTVRETLSMLRETVGKEITIKTDLSRKKCNVEGDPGQMQQLVTNICVNAVEAMKAGGTLTVKTESGAITKPAASTFEEWRPGRCVHLTVSDTGCGMDRDTVARMFEPYFSTKTGGRGLGLATVFGIIKNH